MKMNFAKLLGFLNVIDWSGHVELGDQDKKWLALQLFDFLSPAKDKERCESCGTRQLIVIKTALGTICAECIEEFADEAEGIRDEVEHGG